MRVPENCLFPGERDGKAKIMQTFDQKCLVLAGIRRIVQVHKTVSSLESAMGKQKNMQTFDQKC